MLHLGETGKPVCKALDAFKAALKPYLEGLGQG